jgi:hypothetical protein
VKNRLRDQLEQRVRFLPLVLILTLAEISSSFAQDPVKAECPTRVSGRFGVGIVGGLDFVGVGGIVGVQYSSPVGLFSIRYLGAGRATVDPATLGTNRLAEISEMSVLYGCETALPILYLSASAGLGAM